jgi:polyphosphate kinase 2 (PPK2 family)
MRYRQEFIVKPGAKLRLDRIDPGYRGKHESHEKAAPEIADSLARMGQLQYLLYADDSQSLLVVLQALDAAGKDGVIRHLFTGMNPQGTRVFSFKKPSAEERAHDFLWRIHKHAP